ncbi:beta-1,6-N-acetylglucosaminyltransferase [Mucilaginibacter jinjuensis]|uniref:Peptide O-xylosyltransferase n=1 Tax=Mucilaginibacter jinjuensis TaxID=1176721 RepID=A0ABY7T6K5_9SPHI|nr:beta-1,6-N-acetylglucosaminyltransferase [Mucilaginibacter jinjuensis]WCT11898.1 beta-1,6-N-acetylglucosaminyltransferase [Mucilaginibacter jinjuensis]
MRYALLIINHVSPKQTQRLIERLNNDYFDFYIQLDKKTDAKPYEKLKDIRNVFFINKRVNVHPGGYSALKATMTGLSQIIKSEIKYHSISLVNGSDYPTKRADEICDFLNINKGKQLIAFDEDWSTSIPEKINKYYLADYNFNGKQFFEKLFNKFLGKPEIPKMLKFAGKSAYWTITPNCATYILAYIERLELDSFLKYTLGSDEFIFQSIIMNSPYHEEVINNNYRYRDQTEDGKGVKTLTAKDFNKIIFADSIFAGKFDIEVDAEILDMIDKANQIKISYRSQQK